MAIDNVNVIDGMGVDTEKKTLRLLLADHLLWDGSSLSECEHLTLLQNKINGYITFLEGKQYKEKYTDLDIDMAVIEIHFKHEITSNCEKFLKSVQEQVVQLGIKMEAYVE